MLLLLDLSLATLLFSLQLLDGLDDGDSDELEQMLVVLVVSSVELEVLIESSKYVKSVAIVLVLEFGSHFGKSRTFFVDVGAAVLPSSAPPALLDFLCLLPKSIGREQAEIVAHANDIKELEGMCSIIAATISTIE